MTWPAATAGLLSLAALGWRIDAPSAWRDEAVTFDVAGRSLEQIFAVVRHVDLVHAAYYATVHLLRLVVPGFTPVRVLSAVAMALSVALVVQIGSQLGSMSHGLVAAALMACTPFASVYAQQARSYALATAAMTAATLALVRVTGGAGSGRGRPGGGARGWLGYGSLVWVGCLLNVFTLQVLPAHALLALRFGPTAFARWTRAAGISLLVVGPFLVTALGQRGQVSWLGRPDFGALRAAARFGWPSWTEFIGITLLALGLATVVLRGRGSRREPTPGEAFGWLAVVAWGWGGSVSLWLISQVHPFFDGRYLTPSLPGMALALAWPVTGLSARWAAGPRSAAASIAALVIAVTAGGLVATWPYQVRLRDQGGAENLREVSRLLGANSRTGDAVIYIPASIRLAGTVYPNGVRGLRDAALLRTGADSGTLIGVDREPAGVRASMLAEHQVWVAYSTLTGSASDPVATAEVEVLQRCFERQWSASAGGYTVAHFVRVDRGSPSCGSDPSLGRSMPLSGIQTAKLDRSTE